MGMLTLFCFCQCKSLHERSIEKLVKANTKPDYFNPYFFQKSQELMFDLLPSEVSKSDTVIILEYFTSVPSGNYSCTIYESKNKTVNSYQAATSIVKGDVRVDSLKQLDLKDYILPMVLNNQLQEIKNRGNLSCITPSTKLIINILIKDKTKKKFDLQRLETLDFDASPY